MVRQRWSRDSLNIYTKPWVNSRHVFLFRALATTEIAASPTTLIERPSFIMLHSLSVTVSIKVANFTVEDRFKFTQSCKNDKKCVRRIFCWWVKGQGSRLAVSGALFTIGTQFWAFHRANVIVLYYMTMIHAMVLCRKKNLNLKCRGASAPASAHDDKSLVHHRLLINCQESMKSGVLMSVLERRDCNARMSEGENFKLFTTSKIMMLAVFSNFQTRFFRLLRDMQQRDHRLKRWDYSRGSIISLPNKSLCSRIAEVN